MGELTPKQRILRSLKGEAVDRVPFSPFLAYYFESLPREIQNKGQLEYLEAMGADPLLRGFSSAYEVKNRYCSQEEKEVNGKRYVTHKTPKGDLHSEYTYVAQGDTWFLTKHPVETLEDLYILKTYYEDLEITDERERLNSELSELGERGLYVSCLGSEWKTGYQSLIENLLGTENGIFMTMDYPDAIAELLEVMHRVARKTVELTAQTDVEVCLSWEDSSTTNISPALYRQYILPEISEWCKMLKAEGKHYIQHACGHLKDLLVPMSEQGILAVESLTPYPTGNVTMEEAIELLPRDIAIVGGIDPIMMLEGKEDKIEAYVHHLLDITKDRGFVLANSDSCPPGVRYETFLQLARIVRQRGAK